MFESASTVRSVTATMRGAPPAENLQNACHAGEPRKVCPWLVPQTSSELLIMAFEHAGDETTVL